MHGSKGFETGITDTDFVSDILRHSIRKVFEM